MYAVLTLHSLSSRCCLKRVFANQPQRIRNRAHSTQFQRLFYQCDQASPSDNLNVANMFLETGHFANDWKCALAHPLHKKRGQLINKNFRPVSNLQLISKLKEKAVAIQNQLWWILNCSLFTKCLTTKHSTEIALIKVKNDLLININKKQNTNRGD